MEASIGFTEVSQTELDLVNKLVLALIDIEHFVEIVRADLDKEIEDSPENFIYGEDEDLVSLTGDNLDIVIERVFQSEFNWDDSIPTIVYEKVHERITKQELRTLEAELQFIMNDQRAYERNPLAYFGMRERDFI